jgi:S1-C subfamily serine protease
VTSQEIVRSQRRPFIVRSVLICLLGGALVTLPCVPREPWPSIGANIAVEPGARPGGGEAGRERPIDPLDEQERRVAEAIARARESAVTLEYATPEGPSGTRLVATGVVISDAGEVLSIRIDPPPATAPVVARDASGRRHLAEWLAADAETGLTLLRIKSDVAEPSRAALHEPRLGGQILVIGNPFGLGHSVLRGHISGLDRRLELGPRQLGGLIQVAVALHPGDSGALVTNLRGEWLGLIRSGLAPPAQGQRPGQGPGGARDRESDREYDHDLGFAIPARDALWVADQLRIRGRVDRAYLGVRIDPGAAAEPPGAVLLGVLDDTPAGQAGLLAGDRIVALNGHPIQSPGDLTDRLDRTLAEAEVTLDLMRGERIEHCDVRTVRRPPAPAPSKSTTPPVPDPTPRPDDLSLALPRAVLDRLDRLDRRIDELEKRDKLAAP